jgi:uncharacterized membrane protein YtjA (UPF0391 family)
MVGPRFLAHVPEKSEPVFRLATRQINEMPSAPPCDLDALRQSRMGPSRNGSAGCTERPPSGLLPVPARERKRRIVVDPAASTGARMFKYAVIFLIISLIAGAVGLTNVSRIARRISLVLFALFFLVFLVLIGFAYLVGEAIQRSALVPAVVTVFT